MQKAYSKNAVLETGIHNPPTLRGYQEQFIQETAKAFYFGENRRILAVAPTGFGKTVVLCSIAKRYKEKHPDKAVLVLVHRTELLNQTEDKFKSFGISPFLIKAGVKEIPNFGYYVAMVETLATKPFPENIGLLIIDEAHTANHRKIIDNYNGLILGFTATPLSSSSKYPLKNWFDDLIEGAKVSELIEKKYLAKPILFSPTGLINKNALKKVGGDYSQSSQFQQLKKVKLIDKAINEYTKRCKGQKAVFFNCNIEHNKLIASKLQSLGFQAKSVNGTTPSLEREEIFKWFRTTPGAILCNVELATTGFDEPSVECIVLNFATLSLTKYIQCIGRGSRIDEETGKSEFTILDLCENYLEHGLWEQDRNWKRIFNAPKKYVKGEPPHKKCINPECENIQHASSTICPKCGQSMPRVNIYDLDDTETLTQYYINPIDLKKEYSKGKAYGKNEYYAFHLILDYAVKELMKLGINRISERIIDAVFTSVEPEMKLFYANLSSPKRWSKIQKKKVKKHIEAKLSDLIKHKVLSVA